MERKIDVPATRTFAPFSTEIRAVFGINAAIHFDVDLVLVRLIPYRCAPDFFHLISAKRLSAKTRMNSHDEQHIELPEERFDRFQMEFRDLA